MVLERGSARRGLNERSSLVRAHAPLHFMATVGARRLRAEMRVDETVDSESAILISARRPLAKGVRGNANSASFCEQEIQPRRPAVGIFLLADPGDG